jgi:hypothetical protein
MAEFDNREPREEIFAKAVRAGKRTYFFDVKSTRANEYYLTITESKRRFGAAGEKPYFEKHKIFLYKEDFDKFSEGLNEVVSFIRAKNEDNTSPPPAEGNRFSDVDFDDLGEKQ